MINLFTKEKNIEKLICDKAKKNGWLVFKLAPIYEAGIPDRLFIKKGVVYFVEFKKIGKGLSSQQLAFRKKLLEQGMNYFVLDSQIAYSVFLEKINAL